MRKTNILAALLATTLAFPAVAQTAVISDGEAQLAESLNLTPGMYSLEQLTELQGLMGNSASASEVKIQAIIDNPMGPAAVETTAATEMQLNSGEVQLAELLGVEPGKYSLEELAVLADSEEDESLHALYMAVLNGEIDMSTSSDRGVVYPGKAQLADALGVDAAAYTTLELAQMRAEMNNEAGIAAE